MKTSIILSFFVQSVFAMPNQAAWDILVQHWLDVKSVESKVFDPNVQEKHIFTVWPCYGTTKDDYLVIRTKDPNTYLEVTKFHRNRVNMLDLDRYLKTCMALDPNYPRIVEPNEPPDPCEPNLAEMLEGVSDPNLIKMLKELEAMK